MIAAGASAGATPEDIGKRDAVLDSIEIEP